MMRKNLSSTKLDDQIGAGVGEDRVECEQALLEAATDGDEARVKEMLGRGVDLNVTDILGKTALSLAAEMGHIQVVELLVANGANIEGGSRWRTPLMGAVANNRADVVRLLVDSGVAVNMANGQGQTALLRAVGLGFTEVVRILLDNQGDIDSGRLSYGSLLVRAVRNGRVDIVRLLLERGASANTKYGRHTAFMIATDLGHVDIMRLLLTHGANVKDKTSGFETPLLRVVKKRRIKMTRVLLEHSSNTNADEKNGWTPLTCAIRNDDSALVNRLLQYEAEANGKPQGHPVHSEINDAIMSAFGPEDDVRDGIECSPLAWASKHGSTNAMRVLFDHRANIEAADKYGRTALMMAVRYGKSSAVDLLLDYGAAIDDRNTNSKVLLQLVIRYDHALLVGILSKHNAPMTKNEKESRSLLVSLVKKCRSGIVTRDLLDVFPHVKITDPICWTTFVAAVEGFGHLDRMGYLVALGSTFNAMDSDDLTLLQWAINHNHVEIVKTLAENNVAVKSRSNKNRSPLMQAVENNNIDLMRVQLEGGANVNASESNRRAPLKRARSHGHTDELQMLVDHRAVVNTNESDGWTPMILASRCGHTDAMKLLIDHSADVNAKKSDGCTSLMLASRYGHTDAVKLLIKHSAEVNARNISGRTPLMFASGYGHTDAMKLLIDHSANLNAKDATQWTPLMLACRYGHTNAIRLLIDHNADINAMDGFSMTPLTQAIKYGHIIAVILLVGYGATVSTNYRMGDTLFQWFVDVDSGRVAELQASVQFGSDFDDSDSNERSEFLKIGWRDNTSEIDVSKDHGAEVDIWNKYSSNLFTRAAKSGKANTVRLLAAYGAGVDTEDLNGQTPLMIAAKNGSTDIVRALSDCGAAINATSSSTGETALMTAARYGYAQVVRLLLGYGATVNVASHNGETALSIATKYGCKSIVSLLTRHVVYEDGEMATQNESDRNVQCSWFISPFELEFLRFGDVRGDIRGTWLGAEVIVKLFVSDATNATFIDEVNLWHKLRHPNIIKLYGACNVGHHFFVYEYASSGSLVDYLRKCDHDRRTPWKYLHESALGLKYLHERGIVHGDLRGSNILIGNDGLAKLSAFDVSASSNTRVASESGEWVRWTSPEAIRGEKTSLSSDIFSFGVCMLEALTRRRPWSDLSESEVLERHRSFESLDQPLDLVLSKEHWNVISRMCCSNPLDRLNVSVVVQKLEALSQMERFGVCELEQLEFNPPGALDDAMMERRLSKVKQLVECSDNALHHQLVGDLDLVHDQLKNVKPTRTLVDRFHDVLRQCCAALRVVSAKHRIYQLSSTQATINNVHELHRRVVQLLQNMGAPADVVTNCKELWKVKRRKQMEMFVSAVSDKCVILQRLETEDDRKVYLAILDEEMHNQEATYTDHQLGVMHNVHDAIANQTLDDVSLTSPPEWFIPWFELDKNGTSWIADGGFGSVSRWRWLDSEVVVKTMHSYDGMDCSKKHQMRKMFERETDIWFRLSHPHVVKLFGACHVGRPFFVCEYASNGTLTNYIRRHPDRIWIKLREAALGVQYLHARGIVHGDLKGNNIVIGADEKAKVVDFGLSWLCDDSSTVAPVSGACGWVAPECLEEKPATPTLASDVYSLGMCIIEALNVIGNVKITTPWGDLLPVVVKREATDGKLPTRPQNCSSEVWHLVERMCKRDPANRIRIATVVEELTKLAMQSEKCEDLNKKSAESTIFALPLSEQDEKALELYPPPDEESVVDLIDGMQAHIIGHLDELKATYTSRTLGAIYRLLWERLQDVIEHLQDQDEEIITEAAFNHFVLVARARTLLLVENMHQPKLVSFTEGALGGYGLHRRLDTLLDSNRVVLNNHELHDWRTKFSAMLGIE